MMQSIKNGTVFTSFHLSIATSKYFAKNGHNTVPNIVPINMAPNAKKPAVALLIIKSGSNSPGYGRFQARSARYPYPAKDKNANGRIPMQNLIFYQPSNRMVNCTIAGTRIKSGKKSISSRNIQPPCCISSPQNGHFMKPPLSI